MEAWARLSVALAALLVGACGSDRAPSDGTNDAGSADAGVPDSGAPDSGATDPRYLERLEGGADYAALQGEGAEVKYLARVDGRSPPAPFQDSDCIFQNTRDFAYHVTFLKTFEALADLDYETYLDLVLRSGRVWWGGGLKAWPGTLHPVTNEAGVISYTVYDDPASGALLSVDAVAEVNERLRACAPYAEDLLVFVPDGAAQLDFFRNNQEALAARGVAAMDPARLRAGLGAEIYSEGEGYGTLRIVPRGASGGRAGPRDVLVTESPPGDVAVLGGLVTALPQSLHSHVNLRLREKHIPNASIPDLYDNDVILGLRNQLVHIEARAGNVTVEAARLEDAEAFWEANRPAVGMVVADLDETAMRAFAEIGAEAASAYGAKAANLGELHAALPPEHRVEGFGIPLRAYVDFMDAAGLDEVVEALLDDDQVKTDAAHKRARLASLRAEIKVTPLPESFAEDLEAQMRAVFGAAGLEMRTRFRSSTNAEDLSAFSGAGLYESRSGCFADDLDGDTVGPSHCLTPEHAAAMEAELELLRPELEAHPDRTWVAERIQDLEEELTEEKSAHQALRKVWASLWNERAFDEREYYGLDHEKVFMAVAVQPAFTRERLDAVAVTNLATSDLPTYRLVSQEGEVGVVRPWDPTAVAETLTFQRTTDDSPTSIEVLVPSSRVPEGEQLWTEARLGELASLLFSVQDHFATEVYPDIPQLSLDIELKVTHDDRIVLKQARPYIDVGP